MNLAFFSSARMILLECHESPAHLGTHPSVHVLGSYRMGTGYQMDELVYLWMNILYYTFTTLSHNERAPFI